MNCNTTPTASMPLSGSSNPPKSASSPANWRAPSAGQSNSALPPTKPQTAAPTPRAAACKAAPCAKAKSCAKTNPLSSAANSKIPPHQNRPQRPQRLRPQTGNGLGIRRGRSAPLPPQRHHHPPRRQQPHVPQTPPLPLPQKPTAIRTASAPDIKTRKSPISTRPTNRTPPFLLGWPSNTTPSPPSKTAACCLSAPGRPKPQAGSR